jgi:RNA polymerase sigma-70 factor (ECF subfamily)
VGDLATEDLRRLFAHARAAWPAVAVDFEVFAARVDDQASLLAGEWESACAKARDLYLACACSEGDPAALLEFEQSYLAAVHDAVARIDRSVDFIAEVQQILRERLLVGPDAKIKKYRGSGALAGWVRTAAVRTALNVRRSHKPHVDDPRRSTQLEQLIDPEIAMMKERHRTNINAALQRAVARLDAKDRLLLRFYYVDNLTLAKIATLQRMGVSTVFRRLSAATQAVLSGVREELAERLQLSKDSLDSLIREARQEIDLSLSQLLGGAIGSG